MALVMIRLELPSRKDNKKVEVKINKEVEQHDTNDTHNTHNTENFINTVKHLKLEYWVVTAIILFYYMALFPFISFGM